MLPLARFLLFLRIRRVSTMCDVVGVNAERWEERVRNHRRGDVDHAIVVMVCLSFLRKVPEIINETIIQSIMCLRRDFVRCQIGFRWEL